MTKRNDILHYIAKLMNDEQAHFAMLKSNIVNSGLTKIQSGKESLETLTLIHESRRDLLDKLYKEIQSM